MTLYSPHIHHRRSIRLKGYDYSCADLYFITICCQDRAFLFGNVENGKMMLNDAGNVAMACWMEMPNHYPNVVLREMVVMPNHVHGIVEFVGAKYISPEPTTECNYVSPEPSPEHNEQNGGKYISPEINGAKNVLPLRGTSQTVGAVVRGFKIGVTKWMRQNTNIHDVWQRNYHEHIIRDEHSYLRISEYIINNPVKWKEDTFFHKLNG